jgi:N-acyl-D-aspartate/D-glutamate deacylase
MGTKGSEHKIQSVRFPKWMSESIEEIAKKEGVTFTDIVIDLLRQELKIMGYTMGIGREGYEAAIRKKDEEDINKMFSDEVEPLDIEPLDSGNGKKAASQ